jgi:hypothetical protein
MLLVVEPGLFAISTIILLEPKNLNGDGNHCKNQ